MKWQTGSIEIHDKAYSPDSKTGETHTVNDRDLYIGTQTRSIFGFHSIQQTGPYLPQMYGSESLFAPDMIGSTLS
jgi:hypothetical protein